MKTKVGKGAKEREGGKEGEYSEGRNGFGNSVRSRREEEKEGGL